MYSSMHHDAAREHPWSNYSNNDSYDVVDRWASLTGCETSPLALDGQSERFKR